MVKHYFFSLVILIGLSSSYSCFGSPKVGEKAPDFTAQDEQGKSYKLSDLVGQKVALYFYPSDHPLSYGCSLQACSIRDGFSQLKDAGITILGMSNGSAKQKKRFSEKRQLPFPLLRSTNEILELYGVKGDFWSLYLPKRHTFLIDEQGIIVKIITTVDVRNHAQQIIDGFAQKK